MNCQCRLLIPSDPLAPSEKVSRETLLLTGAIVGSSCTEPEKLLGPLGDSPFFGPMAMQSTSVPSNLSPQEEPLEKEVDPEIQNLSKCCQHPRSPVRAVVLCSSSEHVRPVMWMRV